MHALTVKQPWAQAIAQFGKTVENRSHRPPLHLLGQRIAIHVAQAADAAAICLCQRSPDTIDHLEPLLIWMMAQGMDLRPGDELLDGKQPPVPHAGRIIATARLVGYICDDGGVRGFRDAVMAAFDSPWFHGPIGWVLDDVRQLRQPIGPVRGQIFPFALAPEIEAAVLEMEAPVTGTNLVALVKREEITRCPNTP